MATRWAWQGGDHGRAASELDRAEKIAAELADDHLLVIALSLRGILECHDDPVSAEAHFRRAIELADHPVANSDRPNMGRVLTQLLNNLSVTLLILGRPSEALTEIERARRLHQPESPNTDIAVLHTLGAAFLALGRVHEARDQFVASLQTAIENRNNAEAVPALIALACTANALGRHARCLTLLATARRWSPAPDFPPHIRRVTPFEEAERSSSVALGETATRLALQRGRTMDLHQALEFVQPAVEAGTDVGLPPRKLQVVRMVAEGLTNKEIARRLSISERTVDAHLEQVRRQLGLRNRAQVAAWAVSSAQMP
jgi:DNA-binding CsgD family transcriptional regulator